MLCACVRCFESVAGGTGCATIVLWDQFPEGMICFFFYLSHMSQPEGLGWPFPGRSDIDFLSRLWDSLRRGLNIGQWILRT